MKTTLTLTAAALLAGFAPAPAAVTPDAGSNVMVGWIRFSDGEFQLYDREVQVLRPFARPCVSGVASRDIMRMARRDLGGQKVAITGATVAWEQAGHGIRFRGSVVRNGCGGQTVLLADDIQPSR